MAKPRRDCTYKGDSSNGSIECGRISCDTGTVEFTSGGKALQNKELYQSGVVRKKNMKTETRLQL